MSQRQLFMESYFNMTFTAVCMVPFSLEVVNSNLQKGEASRTYVSLVWFSRITLQKHILYEYQSAHSALMKIERSKPSVFLDRNY